jgi:tRNA-splicing ligase RtcB
MEPILVQGKFNNAKIFTHNIEPEAMSQIMELLNQEFVHGSKIRIMPDTHAGAGCTIGTTMTITDKVVPNLVGVDIGCGMYTLFLRDKDFNLAEFDKAVRRVVPAGFDIRTSRHELTKRLNLEVLHCAQHINLERAYLSVGTLGGGNHFIELDRDDDGQIYLIIHTGSRHLGKQVADYYQDLAFRTLTSHKEQILETIKLLKALGKEQDIQAKLQTLSPLKVSKQLAYLEGEIFEYYLEDMALVQTYAVYNRVAIATEILNALGYSAHQAFTTIHNYIDLDNMILRKGAVSAQDHEMLLIPINMRDGSLLCYGRGNKDWNYSAPHGAGRLMSRSKAKETINLEAFKETMNGIYSTTVGQSTLDEAPMAYKPIDEIMGNIQDTVDIEKVLKPIYNFKSA